MYYRLTYRLDSSIPYSALCETFDACESTTKRLAITANLVKLFVETIKLSDAQGLLELLYMCLNKVMEWSRIFLSFVTKE
jgi:DNA ligase-1